MFGVEAPISTRQRYELAVATLKQVQYTLEHAVDDAREVPELYALITKTLQQLGEKR